MKKKELLERIKVLEEKVDRLERERGNAPFVPVYPDPLPYTPAPYVPPLPTQPYFSPYWTSNASGKYSWLSPHNLLK